MAKKNTLSERINQALKKAQFSQADLARSIGVSKQAIQYLCSSGSETSKYTYLIADALKVDPNWLASGRGTPEVQTQHAAGDQQQVPLLSSDQLKTLINQNSDLSDLTVEQCLQPTRPVSSRSVAVCLKDKSMYPKFNEGCLLFFDPSMKYQAGHTVLVYDKQCDDILVRQITNEQGKYYLSPVNQKAFNAFELTDDYLVFGVLKEARWLE